MSKQIDYQPVTIIPRLIRLRDAPFYLGMDKNRFNREVRPFLNEVPMGKQGVAFDRLDLDTWVAEYITRVGRPGKRRQESTTCPKKPQVLLRGTVSGTSTKSSKEKDFMKALDQVTSMKRSAS